MYTVQYNGTVTVLMVQGSGELATLGDTFVLDRIVLHYRQKEPPIYARQKTCSKVDKDFRSCLHEAREGNFD